jgi:hypothetical protein
VPSGANPAMAILARPTAAAAMPASSPAGRHGPRTIRPRGILTIGRSSHITAIVSGTRTAPRTANQTSRSAHHSADPSGGCGISPSG